MNEVLESVAPVVPVARSAVDERVSLRVEIIDSVGALIGLRDDWERLESLDPDSTPFTSWSWAWHWWQAFGHDAELFIVVCRAGRAATAVGSTDEVYDAEACRNAGDALSPADETKADRAVAIAPMLIRRERSFGVFGVRVLRFIGADDDALPVCQGLIAEPGERLNAERVVLARLFADARWQRLDASDVLVGSTFDEALACRLEMEPGVVTDSKVHDVYHDDMPPSWENYRLALNRNRRELLNPRRNRIDQAGETQFAIASTREEIDEAHAALVSLYRERWAHTDRACDFVSRATVAFHKAVVDAFHERDALCMATLRLDGEIIGVQCVVRWHDTFHVMQGGYSQQHEVLSPAHLLFTYLVGEGLAQGVKHVDLQKGNYLHKAVFAHHIRRTRNYRFIRPGLPLQLARLRRKFFPGRLADDELTI